MKKSILLNSLFLVSSMAFAQVDSSGMNKNQLYCAQLRDGILEVVSDQKKITSDIITDNGTVIQANGNVIQKDGITKIMKDGECITPQGFKVILVNNDKTGQINEKKVPLKPE